MLIVDASAAAELLLGRPAGASVARHLGEHSFDLHAPHLLDLEVLSVLRRLVGARAMTLARAEDAIDDLLDLPIERYAQHELIPRVWSCVNFSPYVAAYVALAEVISDDGAALLTTDARLARAVGAHTGVRVVLAA